MKTKSSYKRVHLEGIEIPNGSLEHLLKLIEITTSCATFILRGLSKENRKKSIDDYLLEIIKSFEKTSKTSERSHHIDLSNNSFDSFENWKIGLEIILLSSSLSIVYPGIRNYDETLMSIFLNETLKELLISTKVQFLKFTDLDSDLKWQMKKLNYNKLIVI